MKNETKLNAFINLCIGLHIYYLIIVIIEGGAYSRIKSACLILWPMRWAPFSGRPLRCYKYKWKNDFFFLNPRDGHNCKAHQSNPLLQYMYVLAGHGGLLTLTRV